MPTEVKEFLSFLEETPTAWHTCCKLQKKLTANGFQELEEGLSWKLEKGKSYFVCRNKSSLIAFRVPKKTMERTITLAAHTDSPGLKLKPHPEIAKDGQVCLHFEVYGAPILATFIGRDLALAGRIFFKGTKGVESKLIFLKDFPLIIPNIALHLDRQVNDQGLTVNKQDHLAALFSDHPGFLKELIQKEIGSKAEFLHAELFAVSIDAPKLM